LKSKSIKIVNQDRDQGCYYFNRSRPPEEIEVIFSKFLPWRLLCLKERGWGPPAEPKGGVHVNKTMKVKVSFYSVLVQMPVRCHGSQISFFFLMHIYRMALSPVSNIFNRERNISYTDTILITPSSSHQLSPQLLRYSSASVKAIVYGKHAPIHVSPHTKLNSLHLIKTCVPPHFYSYSEMSCHGPMISLRFDNHVVWHSIKVHFEKP
jgi:hypothetical protein